MSEHIVSAYKDELEELEATLATMGGLTEKLVADAVSALISRNPDRAQIVISSDKNIDKMDVEVNEKAILMIAKRQPMALDLRQIMTAIKMSNDLERIGDLAKNNARRALSIHNEKLPKQILQGLKHMNELALSQLKEVLDSYSQRNSDLAVKVWYGDEELDDLYNSLFRELLTFMMEDPRTIGVCSHFLFIAKNIERIGDHTTNIAEMVHYLVNGEPLNEARPQGDSTGEITPADISKLGKKAKKSRKKSNG